MRKVTPEIYIEVLGRLTEKVDDEGCFDFSGCDDQEAAKAECKRVFAVILEAAAIGYDNTFDAFCFNEPEFPGASATSEFHWLNSCWRRDFINSILLVTSSPFPLSPGGREFLFFLLGFMACGWQEYLRQLHSGPQLVRQSVVN